MNLMFWKKKTTAGTEEAATDDDKTVAIRREAEAGEGNSEESTVRPGLFARLRNSLFALRKPRDTAAKPDDIEAETQDECKATEGEEAPVILARNPKKRLIVGSAIGLLVLLLVGIGFATWKIAFSHTPPKPAPPVAPPVASHAVEPETRAEPSQTEIEALKKKNEELQAQIEAIKKEQAVASQSQAQETRGNAAPQSPSGGGEMTVSNKDPKAAAQALKAAIEAMNAASGRQDSRKSAP